MPPMFATMYNLVVLAICGTAYKERDLLTIKLAGRKPRAHAVYYVYYGTTRVPVIDTPQDNTEITERNVVI